VQPKDEDALAEAISKILLDDSMAKDMGRLSKSIVHSKFTLDLMCDKILEVYKEVVTK